jgi:hypothetical protein
MFMRVTMFMEVELRVHINHVSFGTPAAAAELMLQVAKPKTPKPSSLQVHHSSSFMPASSAREVAHGKSGLPHKAVNYNPPRALNMLLKSVNA